MPVNRVLSPVRVPQARVLRNHERILDATIEVAGTDGWSKLTFATISSAAGLSRRPLADRFPDVSHLAAAAWTHRVGPALQNALSDVLGSGGLLETQSPPAAVEAFERLLRPDLELRAAAELLLISQFDVVVRAAVRDGIGAQALSWCTPEQRVLTRADAARRAYALVVALGLLMAGRRNGIEGIDVSHEIGLIHQAAREHVRPATLPSTPARHLDEVTPFDTGDPTLDALLQSVLDQVGADGFERSSVERIVAHAGSSQGALFSRYETKLDLFLDATRRQNAIALRANEEYMARIAARYGRGIAEAVTIREFQRPGREQLRAITLEQLRLSWHVPELRDAQAAELDAFMSSGLLEGVDRTRAQLPGYAHIGYAIGLGAVSLPLLFPACWSLPYDVMTVPLTA